MAEWPEDIRAEIEKLTAIPAMPELARRIVALGPSPDVDELVAIVELESGLAGQMVGQANSPSFGYRGTVKSIADAITRVMGVETAVHLALGVIAGE